MRAVGDAQTKWFDGLSERAFVISFVENTNVRRMTDEARALAGEIRDKTGEAVVGMRIVVLDQGFRGAMIRSIIGAVELMGRGVHKSVVVKSIDAACKEAAQKLQVPAHAPFRKELPAEIERLREARRAGLTMP